MPPGCRHMCLLAYKQIARKKLDGGGAHTHTHTSTACDWFEMAYLEWVVRAGDHTDGHDRRERHYVELRIETRGGEALNWLAGKELPRCNTCICSGDYTMESCDIQLRHASRVCRGESMQPWRREGIINRWPKSTVLDRNMSVLETRVSTETGSRGINTQTITRQLPSNYCTLTSWREGGGRQCMSVTMEILRRLSCQLGRRQWW